MKKTVIEYIWSLTDGGAETLVKDYALLLNKDRFDVHILAVRPMPDSANTKILRRNHIQVHYVYPKWNLPVRVFHRLFGKYYRPWKVGQILRQQGADVLHCHMEVLKTLMPIKEKLKGMKLFYTCHSRPDEMFAPEDVAEREAAAHFMAFHGMKLIALHEDMRRELNEMFAADTTEVICNGIDMERYQNIAETAAHIRSAEGIPEDAFLLGHVGRLSEVKNHRFLLAVFAEVLKRRPDAFLLMVGDGELRAEIEAEIKDLGLADRVRLLSNRTDVPRLMKAMDVFVFPSRYEGLGIALIEAQASNLRCIVSDAVPQEAFRTPLAVPVSLKESPSRWADLVLDDSIRGPYDGGLDDYDMRKEIKRMEALYLGE